MIPQPIRREWHAVYQIPAAMAVAFAVPAAVMLAEGWGFFGWAWDEMLSSALSWISALAHIGIMAVAVNAVIFAAGLPLRCFRRLNDSWRRHWWLAPAGAAAGIAVFVSAYFAGTGEPYVDCDGCSYTTPNPVTAWLGFLLTEFCTMHFYIPFETIIRLCRR